MSLPLVLASTSPYRRELLARLGLPFEAVAPRYPEADVPGVGAPELALAHALGKAREVARRRPGCLVVGSDQVAEARGRLLGKPGTEEAAVDQLLWLAGGEARFHTGLALVGAGREETWVEPFGVRLRPLDRGQAEAYVRRDRPLGCAGSFRVEALGIALMEALEGRDYTALIGLPLIALTDLLRRFGVDVLAPQDSR